MCIFTHVMAKANVIVHRHVPGVCADTGDVVAQCPFPDMVCCPAAEE